MTRSGPSVHRARAPRGSRSAVVALLALATCLLSGVAGVAGWTASEPGLAEVTSSQPEHLLISEVMTGGASASDEFVELYNPTGGALSLDGLELVYVTASGATITRKASWDAGAAQVAPGAHLLIANEAGVYGGQADAVYASGLAATGGSVALRETGAVAAIDAVGWGTAASGWLEGTPAPAPAAGHSLERLPGGAMGSGQDTDQNVNDFVERTDPDPQSSGAPPVPAATPTPNSSPTSLPSPTPTAPPSMTAAPTPMPTGTPPPMPTQNPTPTPTDTPTPMPTQNPTPTPSPSGAPSATPDPVASIADARALPDGSRVTVEGVALTGGAFTDGGGYLADGSGGIAVLVADGTFPRGVLLRVSGELDDRYHQRTVRAVAADVLVVAEAADPEAADVACGEIGEELEGRLVHVAGVITSAPSQLSNGVAFDLDDGSGAARLVVYDTTGIDTSPLARGTALELTGVVGQRDASGTGTEGYRLQPRDAGDILALMAPTPMPSASASPAATPTPGASTDPAAGVIPIAEARLAAGNARVRVRGVVTLPSATLHDGTAVIQDESGAIAVRLGDEAGELAFGELVVLDGVRSTKSGMETIRASGAPQRLGHAGQPVPAATSTGAVGEGLEAMLVRVAGSVTAAPRRTSSQNVYFDLDDGSGALRVFVTPATGIDTSGIASGSWIEVIGVVGQETSGQQPLRGYRIWMRSVDDLVIFGGNEPAAEGPLAPNGVEAELATGTGATADATTRVLPVLPPPRLVAPARVANPRSSRTPGPRDLTAADAGRSTDGGSMPLQAALLAVVLAGAAGSLAAHRPGLGARLREATAHMASLLGGPREESEPPSPASPVEATVAGLVPLRVVGEDPADGIAPLRERT